MKDEPTTAGQNITQPCNCTQEYCIYILYIYIHTVSVAPLRWLQQVQDNSSILFQKNSATSYTFKLVTGSLINRHISKHNDGIMKWIAHYSHIKIPWCKEMYKDYKCLFLGHFIFLSLDSGQKEWARNLCIYICMYIHIYVYIHRCREVSLPELQSRTGI